MAGGLAVPRMAHRQRLGGQERERGAVSRRGDVTVLDGPRGPSLGGSRPLPLSPHCPSARSLGLSCGSLRILLTQDQPACAKPSTPHGPSCPGKQEVRVSTHLEEQGADKASPGLPFCKVLQTLLTERALKGKERARFIDSSALASQPVL